MYEKELEPKKIWNKTETYKKNSFEIETNDIPNHAIKGKRGYSENCKTEGKLF